MRTRHLSPRWRRDQSRAAPQRRDHLLLPTVTNWSQRGAAGYKELANGPNAARNGLVGINLSP